MLAKTGEVFQTAAAGRHGLEVDVAPVAEGHGHLPVSQA